MDRALDHLDHINKALAGLLPRPDAPQQQPSQREVAASAEQLVQSAAAIQRSLSAFAAAPAPTVKGRLQQEVAALEAELQAADGLLAETEARVQRWRATCERLRSAHADAITAGI